MKLMKKNNQNLNKKNKTKSTQNGKVTKLKSDKKIMKMKKSTFKQEGFKAKKSKTFKKKKDKPIKDDKEFEDEEFEEKDEVDEQNGEDDLDADDDNLDAEDEMDDDDDEMDEDDEELKGAFDFDIGDDEEFQGGKDGSDSEEDGDEEDVDEFKSHKQSLSKLKDIDPEFYKFLEENDKKLLNFNVSDSEAEDDKDGGKEDDKVHKPTGDLEVASDESDFEPDDGTTPDERVITLKLLKKWTNDIKTDKTSKTIQNVMKAFHAALVRVSDGEQASTEYRVDGSSVFNAVIQLCVLELSSAIRNYLRLPADSKQPAHKCKRFVKIRVALKGYLMDLLKLFGGVTSSNIQSVILKHLHGICYLFVSYPAIAKKALRRLITIWSSGEEAVRVLAFLCIVRITTGQPQKHLEYVLRLGYITYVKNSRFVSPQTLPGINFMRRSLVEIYALDPAVSYRHVFLYVRQLAIQLRAAVTIGGPSKNKPDKNQGKNPGKNSNKNKKDAFHAVCGWQYINSIQLWASLLGSVWHKSQAQAHLKPLAYPLIQVAIGAIRSASSVRYIPLRFHVLRTLIHISNETKLMIPILPLLLEALEIVDLNSKHKKVSMKPLNLTCILRVSKSQMSENGFKDAVVDNVYALLLEYLSNQSASIAFPDISLLCTIHLKQFIKNCHVANYTKKMRQLIEKIEQNAQFIEKERKKLSSVSLTDTKQIEAWETGIKNKGTPLSVFFESWRKINEAKKMKELTDNDKLGEYNLPVLKKGQKPPRSNVKEGPVELFPSDSEDDEVEEEEKVVEKPKRGKRGSKKGKKAKPSEMEVDEDVGDDIVEDIKASDW